METGQARAEARWDCNVLTHARSTSRDDDELQLQVLQHDSARVRLCDSASPSGRVHSGLRRQRLTVPGAGHAGRGVPVRMLQEHGDRADREHLRQHNFDFFLVCWRRDYSRPPRRVWTRRSRGDTCPVPGGGDRPADAGVGDEQGAKHVPEEPEGLLGIAVLRAFGIWAKRG